MISDPISHLDNNASSIVWVHCIVWGFPGGSTGKESTCNAGDLGSISGLGRSPGEEKGHPLQYSGLENSMDSMRSIVHGVAKSQIRLSDFHFTSLTPQTKINTKWTKDLNLRSDTIKLLKENITLFDLNHSKIFFDLPPRVMKIKTKINNGN